ncbi:late competence development ComFB family protein [Agaribacterium haliotis]|uniref:late competence development ComFB family protein n=1 Tax=Agaribacterium haliotis TaxID=2013869 RepID=UPI000BB5464C|nr:late competence development ComFB family protein [Agaribacterium haliotis]
MLLSVGRRRYEALSQRDSIHNYFEQMVIDQVLRASDRANSDSDFLADVACVALNRLPPRYVRHDVDMTFFLTPDEIENMVDKVAHAVNDAVDYVTSRDTESKEN